MYNLPLYSEFGSALGESPSVRRLIDLVVNNFWLYQELDSSDSEDEGVIITRCSRPYRQADVSGNKPQSLLDAQKLLDQEKVAECIQACTDLLAKGENAEVLYVRACACLKQQKYAKVSNYLLEANDFNSSLRLVSESFLHLAEHYSRVVSGPDQDGHLLPAQSV